MIDLHVHSIYSDGEYDPLTLLDMCNKRGITTVAITDHNSMEGSKIAICKNPYQNITVISGIELGAEYHVKGGTIHILGYGIDLENKALNEVTKAIMEDNVLKVKSLVSLLKKHYNISFKECDLEKIYASCGNIGRPDIAKLCVSYGYTKTAKEAFVKYFDPVEQEVVKRRTVLTDKDCIEYILNAGGIPCLAHPIELMKDILATREYISSLMTYGLEAVEVYQSKHDVHYSNELLKIVEDFGLLYSVGSDYHGPIITPDIELGFGKEDNLYKNYATILSKLKR